jgi:branched-chain amino acid transport system permease protein
MAAHAFDDAAAGPARDARVRKVGTIAAAVLIAGACVIPLFGSPYQVFQMTLVVIDAIALLGLNVLTGYGGQISLGHGAFFGVGAYTTAILVHRWSVPYVLTLPCAGLVCLALGFLFGLPAVRLDGLHLALATFALGVVLPQILKYKGIEGLTGGVQGISLERPTAPFGLPLSPDQWLYVLALAVAAALFAIARNVMRGPTGRVIVAVRDGPVAASSVGVDLTLTKALTFGVSAMVTGVAGALSALTVQFVGPDSFSIFLSISLLVGIVVGGLASISGAVFGALFIQFVPNLADDVSKAAPSAVYGVMLIVSVYLMPYGVAGLVRKVTAKAKGRLEARIGARPGGSHTLPTSPSSRKQGS